ncbi:hypothetical protein KP77_32460 [Jeotgalibacillus alimentarius]|uniref:Uncharacterized protein n=1 Tax=Jeotgalibacillus alimentarius TaxID=135826 RepID=A0A0C2QZS2_9BACL|nr:hypothetical protein KP77_32460 [Jeotgalibacillus alimentarius]
MANQKYDVKTKNVASFPLIHHIYKVANNRRTLTIQRSSVIEREYKSRCRIWYAYVRL